MSRGWGPVQADRISILSHSASMLCINDFKSNTFELTVHTSCLLHPDLLHVNYGHIYKKSFMKSPSINKIQIHILPLNNGLLVAGHCLRKLPGDSTLQEFRIWNVR